MIERTTRARECARPGCETRYDDLDWQHPWSKRFCSAECARGKRSAIPMKRKAISPASTGQRLAVQGRACIVCRQHAGECDPAHIISRAALTEGQDDPRAVVPLCRSCHDAYDHAGEDLLPYLEPHYRAELAYAVERYGLLRTLQRVTNQRWLAVERDREAAA